MSADALRVAVVGAGGQVGSELLAALAGDPRFAPLGICRNDVSAGPLRYAGLEVRCGSVADPGVGQQLLADCDVIVNCTQTSGSPAQARLLQERLVRSLCDLPGQKRIIQFSSVAVYGRYIDPRRSTFERPRPNHPYGREKRNLEERLAKWIAARPHSAVILRVGHVYGAGQGLSGGLLRHALDPAWSLPFGGRRPSNAIHVRNVAAAMRTLALDWPTPGAFNLIDAPATTWRDVFDWHTQAVGSPPVPDMDNEQSERHAERHRRIQSAPLAQQAQREVTSWAAGLPSSLLASCPTIKDVGRVALASVRNEKLDGMLQRRIRRAAAGRGGQAEQLVEPRLLSKGAPGPALSYSAERSADDAAALAAWHVRSTTPEAILHWNSVLEACVGTPVTVQL